MSFLCIEGKYLITSTGGNPVRRIYINGVVYTVTQGIEEAFVVERGKFLYVGNSQTALEYQNKESEVIDLEGKFVTAGFNDSHMHVLGYGYALQMVNLAEHTTSLEEMQQAIKRYIYINKLEENEWVRGRGWNHDYFNDTKRFPTRYDLDEISTQYPICMIRACGHACVVNSKALEIAGITKDTLQVEGGAFDVDEQGEPLGIFRESALGLIYDKIPKPSRRELKAMLTSACKNLNSYGVTSAQTDDFIVFPQVSYQEVIKAYEELEAEGKLTVKIYEQAQVTDQKELAEFIGKGYTTGAGTDYFKIGPLKLLGDGSLGARTAYLGTPYADDPATRGIAVYTQEQFDEMIGYAHEKGMQVAIHAIGDGIMERIVKAIEKALIKQPRDNHRHGIVHCQITTPKLIEKMKELDLCAYIQTIFLDYDIHIVEERVGKERAKTTYNFKTLLDQGTIISNGSDCPVELPNVLEGIQCAVTRCTLDGKNGPFLSDQALTVEEAIHSYTIMGAYTSFEENTKGSIEEGKVADFVILEGNPLSSKRETIKDISIGATYVDGKCVYSK